MTEISFGDSLWLDLLEVMVMGLTQFMWACFLVYLSFRFFKWLVLSYKEYFYKDELDDVAKLLKPSSKRTITQQQAIIALALAIFQGLYFVGMLTLVAHLQTPFG